MGDGHVFLATGWARLTYVTHIIETLYCMTVIFTFPCHSFLFTLRFLSLPIAIPTGPSPVFVSVNDLHSKVLHYRNSKPYATTRTRVLQRESFQRLADGEKKLKPTEIKLVPIAKLRERKQGAGICFLFFSHSYLGVPKRSPWMIGAPCGLLQNYAIAPPFFPFHPA